MILFQLDKGAIENIDERLKESLSIYLKRKEMTMCWESLSRQEIR